MTNIIRIPRNRATIPAGPIRVSNSNDSYVVQVYSDLELPNINFTDSDGTTTSVPSMENIVATPFPEKVVRVGETKDRRESVFFDYPGTVRNVPSTYPTITAAWNASSSGDVIQLADGTYLTSDEPSGYLLINDFKDILVKGNAADKTAVVIEQNSPSSFGIRMRLSGWVTFQDLTIKGNQANRVFLQQKDTASSRLIIDNCTLESTYTSISTVIDVSGGLVADCYTEFRNSIFIANSSANSYAMNFTTTTDAQAASFEDINFITNCEISGGILIGDSAIRLTMYNSAVSQPFYNADYVFAVGTDAITFNNSSSVLDIRSNRFSYDNGFYGHAILLGGGTKNIYFINNTIFTSSVSDPVALGIVIKSTAVTVGDSIISGNDVIAPRPFYLKGGQNNVIQYNRGVSNWADLTNGYGFDIQNPDGTGSPIESTGNIITDNCFEGYPAAIRLSTEPPSGDAKTSTLTGDLNYNTYRVPSGAPYVISTNDGTIQWADRGLFWNLDENSDFLEV